MAFSSVRSINFYEKKRFLLFWICDSVALGIYTVSQFCKLISFCINVINFGDLRVNAIAPKNRSSGILHLSFWTRRYICCPLFMKLISTWTLVCQVRITNINKKHEIANSYTCQLQIITVKRLLATEDRS